MEFIAQLGDALVNIWQHIETVNVPVLDISVSQLWIGIFVACFVIHIVRDYIYTGGTGSGEGKL